MSTDGGEVQHLFLAMSLDVLSSAAQVSSDALSLQYQVDPATVSQPRCSTHLKASHLP